MDVKILASGSSGNCIALTSNETTILVDAGIAKTKIEKRLLDVGIRPDRIKGIFITHAHSDHVKGLPLANKYKIPVYASEGEWKLINSVEDELKRLIGSGEGIDLQEQFYIEAFKTHHDSYDSLGFTVHDYSGKCSICLDTGHIDDEILQAMTGSDIYIIEANHEPNMVEASDYPERVKARILSNIGHLSNQQAAEALSKLILGKGEQIYLTHLSSKNNFPALAEMTVKRALAKQGYIDGKHYFIEVI